LSDLFADIRPYRDEEILAVVRRLVASREFLDVIARWRFGSIARLLPWLFRPVVRVFFAWELRNVADIRSMQQVIKSYMDRMIDNSSSGFSSSGIELLPADKSHLYMSNHRDIAMDPAFTNYALHQQQRDTVRIAIGDNLLTKPWVSDLMRLNKSFSALTATGGRACVAGPEGGAGERRLGQNRTGNH
jgi:1-acyl-sn-glycerol-3-phosphate acyltransferase